MNIIIAMCIFFLIVLGLTSSRNETIKNKIASDKKETEKSAKKENSNSNSKSITINY